MTRIIEKLEFESLANQIKPYIGWQVPTESFEVSYVDWHAATNPKFVPFIVSMTKLAGDQNFYFYDLDYMLDGDNIEEYFKYAKSYPMLRCSLKTTGSDYVSELHQTFKGRKISETDNNNYVYTMWATNSYIIFSTSMSWYIYGEYHLETAKFVSKVGMIGTLEPFCGFIPTSEIEKRFLL